MKKFATLVLMIFLVIPCFSLEKPDKIFKKSVIKKRMETAALWQLEHPKHEQNDWTNGAFFAGVMAAWETTGSKKLYKAMVDMGETNKWKPAWRLIH